MIEIDQLRKRSDLLGRLRAFFRDRDFLEVETPLVASEAIPEQHIGLFQLESGGWLQASPEMHHKRLLCEGAGPIFEVTRSFRRGESGGRHHPEFTIVEWYRPGDDMETGIKLLSELLQELLDAPTPDRTTYREAFQRVLGIDPHKSTTAELERVAQAHGVDSAGLTAADRRDEWLNVLLDAVIEPSLGQDRPEALYHYPASQSALAKTALDAQGVEVAERFELYWRGLELANGYHELTDPLELRRRLELANEQRVAQGMPTIPLPERLLAAMKSLGLPSCAGVALGFDRLVMVATGAKTIGEVRAFADND